MRNSRPLIPISDDPNDLGPLPQFMFLTGIQSHSLPLLAFQSTFWPKHILETPNLKVNDMVLLTSETLPPLQWPLGRILEVFLGNDGYVRTVLCSSKRNVCLVLRV